MLLCDRCELELDNFFFLTMASWWVWRAWTSLNSYNFPNLRWCSCWRVRVFFFGTGLAYDAKQCSHLPRGCLPRSNDYWREITSFLSWDKPRLLAFVIRQLLHKRPPIPTDPNNALSIKVFTQLHKATVPFLSETWDCEDSHDDMLML